MSMAVAFWVGLLVVVVIIFWRLWKLAINIERDEDEERRWKEYLDYIKMYYPAYADQYQDQFDQRFKLN
jgi:hypothetical protein